MQDWLLQLFIDHQYLVYAFLVLTCVIEGPILTIVCGILLKVAGLPLVPIFIALVLGDLLGDVTWYWLGRKFGHPFVKRFGKYFSINENEISVITKIFHKYHEGILFVSKVTMGLGFAVATLFVAGMVKISFKKYMLINALGQLIWTASLLGCGYLFGHLYDTIDGILGKVSLVTLLIMTFFALLGYGKYIKKRMIERNI